MKASFRQHGFMITSLITVVAKSPPTASPLFDKILDQVKKDSTTPSTRSTYTQHITDENVKIKFIQSWSSAVYGVIDGAHR